MKFKEFFISSGIFALSLGLSLSISVKGVHAAEGQLSLLVWEGYADQSFVKDFEKESGCKVQAFVVCFS
jgi:putative spermidine/putrescine transport system substrate-binding protein/spermidine/putrescine transport system substrate-binding protein